MSTTETSTPDRFDLDGRVFDLVSSTASIVDALAPTRFRYSEDNGVIWGDYLGDTVSFGRFCGSRDETKLLINFVHRAAQSGKTIVGTATSVISVGPDSALLLTEDFIGPDGLEHVSVCREIRI